MEIKEIIQKVKDVMKERDYWLHSTNGDETTLHYMTPFEEKPNFTCDVYIISDKDVEFRFRYLTKTCIILTTDLIGSFFDENHFHKFEVNFWNAATVLYNYEKQ